METTKRVMWKQLLKWLDNYEKSRGTFPRLKTINEKFGWSDRECNFIINRLLKTGKIEKKANWYRLVNRRRFEELRTAKNIDADMTKEELAIINKVVKIVSLIVGLILSCISIAFTYQQFSKSIGTFLAAFSSFSIVAVLIISYQIVLLMRIKKKWFQLFLFGVVFFVALMISLSSTIFTQVGGVLENRRELKQKNSANSNNVLIYENLKKEIVSIETEIEELKENRELYRRTVKTAKETTQAWKDANWWINKYGKELKVLAEKLELKNKEVNTLLESDIIFTTQNDDVEVYEWLEKVTGKSKRFFEFFLSIFFAVFIDIAAPLLMSVATITRRDN